MVQQMGASIICFLNILCMGESFLNFVIIIIKDVSFNYTLLQGWSFTAEMVQQMGGPNHASQTNLHHIIVS